MAEEIEMDDFDRGEEEENIPRDDSETQFIEDDDRDREEEDRPDPNRSIVVIDTSVPNIRRDAGVFKRAHTQDKKDFLKDNLNIRLNKTDGPSSTTLFDNIELTMDKIREKVNGMKYKGVKIVVLKDGKLDYSTAKSNANAVNEFKELVKRAEKEYKKTAGSIIEEKTDSNDQDLVRSVLHNSRERLEDFIDEEYERVVTQAGELKISGNELREVRGILEGGIHDQQGITDEQRIEFLEVDKKHWLELSEKETDQQKAKFYKSVIRIADLEQDNIRLKMNLKPESKEANEILNEEIETGDLSRFEKFKKWAKNNLFGLSTLVIAVGGIITTIIIGARGALRKGSHAVKSFGKAVGKVLEKVGPLAGAFLNLISKALEWGAKGINFLANNLWIIVLIIVGYLVRKYKEK